MTASSTAPINSSSQSLTRLHVSPLNPALLQTLLHSSDPLQQSTRHVSYHTVQTFPESNYGYVELPTTDAQNLKRKFHGSILKGAKLKVEEARPRKTFVGGGGIEGEVEKGRVIRKERIRDSVTLRALVLPDGRRVQRGWTYPKGSLKRDRKNSSVPKASVMAKSQCLFKAKVPPNLAQSTHLSSKTSKADKRPGKRKNKSATEVVVQEFASTTKYPSFLKSESRKTRGKPVVEYIDGKGWVDEDGNVVESVKSTARKSVGPIVPMEQTEPQGKAAVATTSLTQDQSVDEGGSSSSSQEEDTSGDSSEVDSEGPLDRVAQSSASRSSRSSSSTNHPQTTKRPPPVPTTSNMDPPSRALSIIIPTDSASTLATETNQPQTRNMHPLEAIFKKRRTAGPSQQDKAEVPTGTATTTTTEPGAQEAPFRFFGHDADKDADDTSVPDPVPDAKLRLFVPPQTPFTQLDFAHRRIRSAAPTPDTAAPGKSFGFAWRDEDDAAATAEEEGEGGAQSKDGDIEMGDPAQGASNETEAVERGSGSGTGVAPQEGAEKGFEELFWERRGETNRAWKRRRRETGKTRRKMENRRLGGGGAGAGDSVG